MEVPPVELPEERFPWTGVSNLCLGAAALFSVLALARYGTYHNETFDLAFYTRIVWGAGRGDFYNPMVGASLWGLHLSWVLLPLGLLGRLVPVAPMLLVVQAVAVAAAAIPLARIAARRVGHPAAAYACAGVYFLLPVVGSIATYEFHPSSLALLPLAVALELLDRRRARPALYFLAAAALCREDVALVTGMVGVAMALRRDQRRLGALVALVSFAYFALWLLVVAPRFLPRAGSLQLHYGHLGATPSDILGGLIRHPIAVLKTLATPVRLLYVPRLLVPVAFTALLAPRWLLPALAPVAVNVLSQFPTAPQVHSHYATLTVPFLLAASAHGVGRLVARAGTWGDRQALAALAAVSLGSIHMQHRAGSLPLVGGRFDRNAYAADARQAALDTLVDLLPREASVSAPDHLLPHLAERLRLFRAPPPARRIDYLVLSTDHRALFAGRQELWRSDEERLVRGTLSRRKYGVFAVVGPYLVLRVGWPVRSWARTRYVDFDPDPRARAAHLPAGPSLTLAGWGRSPQPHGTHVVLLLVATRPWPLDLGLELGWGPMRPHLDRQDPTSTYAFQPFDGVFLPMYVRVGEVVRTEVDLPATAAELSGGLYLGARRVDGSRLDPSGPHWVRLP